MTLSIANQGLYSNMHCYSVSLNILATDHRISMQTAASAGDEGSNVTELCLSARNAEPEAYNVQAIRRA